MYCFLIAIFSLLIRLISIGNNNIILITLYFFNCVCTIARFIHAAANSGLRIYIMCNDYSMATYLTFTALVSISSASIGLDVSFNKLPRLFSA